jgi:hypothetical protein
VFLSAGQLGAGVPFQAEPDAPRYDWGIAYYMSYDNSLDGFGTQIIREIERGTKSATVVAAVQADFADDRGVRRYILGPGGMHMTSIGTEDSGDEDQAIAYLRWFVKGFPCRRYVITFLDHGGKVDQMCSDRNPATPGRYWMSGHDLAQKLRKLIAEQDLHVELLFLQQCGRGSIENLYSFRGAANYVMSSPVVVGAPNTYYVRLHQWLAEHPEATGAAVAGMIAREDRDFTLYTCARGKELDALAAKLDHVIQPFLAAPRLTPPDLPPVIFSEGNEPIVDLCVYLRRLASENDIGLAQTGEFRQWLEQTLLTGRYVKGGSDATQSLCGLSLFVPAEPGLVTRYAYLDLYRDTRLQTLWELLMGDAIAD